jgi:hypothetical protein
LTHGKDSDGCRETGAARQGDVRARGRRPSGSEGSYEYLRALGFEAGGAVRISVGPVTTFGDVHRFMRFVATFAA